MAMALGCGKHHTSSTRASNNMALCSARTPVSEVTPTTHLIGWGSGQDAITADDAARAEIAKVFSVTVRQDFESNQRALIELNDAGRQMSASTTQKSITQSSTVATLKGVEIARHWMDGDHHCALAVLNRDRAADRLRSQISLTEQAISAHLNAATPSSNPFTVLQHLNTAIDRATERDEFNQTLLILERQHSIEPELSSGSLRSKRRDLLTNAGVRISAMNLPESLRSSLNSELHNHGLTIDSNGRIRIQAALSTKLNGPDDYGFHHVTARLTVQFFGSPGTSISEFQIDARASSQRSARAKDDAIEQLVQKFNANDNAFENHVNSLLQQRIAP